MSLMDQAKGFAEKNPEKVDQAVEKVGELINDKTGGKFADQIDQAEEAIKGKLHN